MTDPSSQARTPAAQPQRPTDAAVAAAPTAPATAASKALSPTTPRTALSPAARSSAAAPQAPQPAAPKAPPARPTLVSPNAPPVLAKLTPPFSIRMTQLFWILSFAVGGFGIVYSFIIRREQVPLIAEAVKTVDAARNEQTYTTAADIIYWSVFGVLVAVVLVQITLLVSFMARRPKIRWWQLLTLVVQLLTLAISLDLALTGERAAPLRLILAAQCALVLLALLSSVMPKAIAWSARRRDIVPHQKGDAAPIV